MKTPFRRRKFWLKVLSFIFSIFIWLYVVSTTKIEVEKNLYLNYVLPPGQSLAENYTKDLVLNIEGPRLLVRKFLEKAEEIRVVFDESNKKGKDQYQFNMMNFLPKLPFGVKLARISPKNLQLKVEKTLFKKVPIRIASESRVLDKFKHEDFTFNPNEIEVSGPRSLVKSLRYISSEALNEFDNKKKSRIELDLQKIDERLSFSQTSSFVNYVGMSDAVEFTFNEIPIIFQSVAQVTNSSHNIVHVTVKGNSDLLKKINKSELSIYAKVEKSQLGNQKIKLSAKLKSGLELIKIIPEGIDVVLEKR